VANIFSVGNIAHGSGAVIGVLTGFAITLPEKRATIAVALGVILAFSLWAATVGRPRVNLSQAPGYSEAKAGYDALVAGRNQEAVQWLQEAVSAEPKNDNYWTNLGVAYLRLGNESESLDAYHKALDLGSPDGANGVAWILATSKDPAIRNPARALEYARKAISSRKDSPNPSHLDTLAEAYYANGQYQEAVQTEQQAIALVAAESRGSYEKSLEKYQHAISDRGGPKATK